MMQGLLGPSYKADNDSVSSLGSHSVSSLGSHDVQAMHLSCTTLSHRRAPSSCYRAVPCITGPFSNPHSSKFSLVWEMGNSHLLAFLPKTMQQLGLRQGLRPSRKPGTQPKFVTSVSGTQLPETSITCCLQGVHVPEAGARSWVTTQPKEGFAASSLLGQIPTHPHSFF